MPCESGIPSHQLCHCHRAVSHIVTGGLTITNPNSQITNHITHVPQLTRNFRHRDVVGPGSIQRCESESKVINKIFGLLQLKKNEVRYLENICQTLEVIFFILGGVFHKSYKSKYHSIYKNKIVSRALRKTGPN